MVNHSDIEDESEEEEEDDDEEEEEEDDVPDMSHTSTELTDALTYMSKSDLDKLRGVSESANKIHTTSSSSSSSESLSTLKITNSCTKTSGGGKKGKGKGKGKECEEVVTVESKEESTSTVSSSAYEHVTYMSIADLNALRGQVSDSGKKKVSDKRVDGYAYESGEEDEDDNEDDDEEEEGDDEDDDEEEEGEEGEDDDQGDDEEGIHLHHFSRPDQCQGQGKRRKVSRCKRAGKRSRHDHDKLFSVTLTTDDSSITYDHGHSNGHGHDVAASLTTDDCCSVTYDHAHGHGHDVASSNGITTSLTTGDCSITYDHDHVVACNEVSAHCCDQHHGCSEDGCEDDEEIEEENEEDIRLRREEALDIQYEESDDKLWANIPAGELTLPFSLPFWLH